MADKKVGRSIHPVDETRSPSEQLASSLSDNNIVIMAGPARDQAKATLVGRFREREERYRREQSAKARDEEAGNLPPVAGEPKEERGADYSSE